MSEIQYHHGGAEQLWRGFDAGRALAWTRVLRVHWPSWPGATAMWLLSTALAEGKPAGLADWVDRARVAEETGFSPETYDRLHRALDAIPAIEHPSHPDNTPDPRWPVHSIRIFDTGMWSDWPWLVASGWEDEEAARLLLSSRDLLP